MSGIAQLMVGCGGQVSGSDLKESRSTFELRKLGVRVYIGHRPENIEGADLVVYSSAVKEDNPEMVEALKRFHDEVRVPFPQNSYPCPFNMFFSPDAEALRTDTIPSEVATAFKRCATIFKALHPLIKPNVLCHGDFHTGNTPLPSDSKHSPLITNFESASSGDPLFDVVKFSVRLAPRDRRNLFITYLGDRDPTEQETAHFELMDLLLLMVVVRVRFGSAQRWLAEGTGGPSMTTAEMEALCQSKDPLPSFLSIPFGQMVVRDRQLGAIYALHEFLRRTEGEEFQRLLTVVAQPKVSG